MSDWHTWLRALFSRPSFVGLLALPALWLAAGELQARPNSDDPALRPSRTEPAEAPASSAAAPSWGPTGRPSWVAYPTEASASEEGRLLAATQPPLDPTRGETAASRAESEGTPPPAAKHWQPKWGLLGPGLGVTLAGMGGIASAVALASAGDDETGRDQAAGVLLGLFGGLHALVGVALIIPGLVGERVPDSAPPAGAQVLLGPTGGALRWSF